MGKRLEKPTGSKTIRYNASPKKDRKLEMKLLFNQEKIEKKVIKSCEPPLPFGCN
jgi:hypothetical protein